MLIFCFSFLSLKCPSKLLALSHKGAYVHHMLYSTRLYVNEYIEFCDKKTLHVWVWPVQSAIRLTDYIFTSFCVSLKNGFIVFQRVF